MSIISSQESNALVEKLQSIIRGYNSWEAIRNFFDTDEIGKRYFEDASCEVSKNGNNSITTMAILALENMSERIMDADKLEENSDVNKLQQEIYKLESEIRRLKRIINSVYGALEESREKI